MEIVDAQIHFGPGGIDEVLAAMDALGISAVLADEFWGLDNWGPGYRLPNGVLRVTTPTVELASAQHPERFAYVLRVERLDPEVTSLVRMASDAPGAKAIRMLPSLTAEELAAFEAGAYADVFRVAGSVGLPVFLYIAGHVELLPRYLEQFPEVQFVVDHCGMPMEQGISFLDALTPDQAAGVTEHGGPDSSYFDEVLKIAAFPNAALKWSHAQGMFGVLDYPFADLMPYLRRALDAFGPERVMWASDMGGNQTGETWAELLFYMRDSTALTNTEKQWLLGKTVRSLLNWDE
jgi:predicted TIM-barrel fold metal-dependent hydrolase